MEAQSVQLGQLPTAQRQNRHQAWAKPGVIDGTTSVKNEKLPPRDLDRVVMKALFLIENSTPRSPDGICLTSTRGIPCTLLVRSRCRVALRPNLAAASCTPRPPRRLLLTEPAASPHHPHHAMDAPSLAARAAVPPSASHRLPTPARRYSRCHRGSRETRPLRRRRLA